MLGFLVLVIYLFVLIGSVFALGALFWTRTFVQKRTVSMFVRSVNTRAQDAKNRGLSLEETPIERPTRSPRTRLTEMPEVSVLVRKAEKECARGKYEDAERTYIQALTVNPDAHTVQAELAKLYLETGREAKAEALYRELLSFVDDVSYHANLGLAYYKQGKYRLASHAYKKAYDKDDKNSERAYALGRAYIADQRFEEAAPYLEKASVRLSKDIELLHMLAECYLQLGYSAQAEDAYRRINKLHPYDEQVKAKLSMLQQHHVQAPVLTQ